MKKERLTQDKVEQIRLEMIQKLIGKREVGTQIKTEVWNKVSA